MFKLNCEDVYQILLNDQLAPKIQRIFFSILVHYYSIVVELDIPWCAEQVEVYGRSFEPWSEKMFKKVVSTLAKNLVTKAWTFLVSDCRDL